MIDAPDEWLTTYVQALPGPALLTDEAGRLMIANPSAQALFPALRQGVHIAQAMRDSAFLAAIDAVLAGQTNARTLTMSAPTKGPASETGTLAVEITGLGKGHRRRLIVRLFDRSDEERLARARMNFVAAASHELRTPLAAILGLVETLTGPAREDAQARERFLSLLAEQAGRMQRLVDSLLDFSRLQMQGEADSPRRAPVDIACLLKDLVRLNAERAAAAGMEIALKVKDNGPHVALAAETDVERVFQNLIDNAVAHAASGGLLEIRLRRKEKPGRPPRIAIGFRDRGPGIAKRHLPHLTEPFYRVPGHGDVPGSGLGLAIVARLLARNDGRLKIKSRPGKGSRFTVELPAAEDEGLTAETPKA